MLNVGVGEVLLVLGSLALVVLLIAAGVVLGIRWGRVVGGGAGVRRGPRP